MCCLPWEKIYTPPPAALALLSWVEQYYILSIYARSEKWCEWTRYPNWGLCNNSIKRVFQLDIVKPYKKPMKCKVLQITSVWERRFVDRIVIGERDAMVEIFLFWTAEIFRAFCWTIFRSWLCWVFSSKWLFTCSLAIEDTWFALFCGISWCESNDPPESVGNKDLLLLLLLVHQSVNYLLLITYFHNNNTW